MGCRKLSYYQEGGLEKNTFFSVVGSEKRETEHFFGIDYYPYGKILREWNPQTEKYLTTHHERDTETGLDYRGARYYDSDIARFSSIDPLQMQFADWSSYNYVLGNPVRFTDPDGRKPGEYELNGDKGWEKTSTKGDDIGVDFYHTDGKDDKGNATQTTYVTDREGNWNSINNGRYTLSGEQRSPETNWLTIFTEWETGTGPATSFFEGNHQTINEFKDHYLINERLSEFKSSGEKNNRYESGFGVLDIFKTGGEEKQVQMMGNYNISFYKLGDKTLTIGQDSKSRSSLYYHLPFIQNYERGVHPGNQESTTRQNYLFFK